MSMEANSTITINSTAGSTPTIQVSTDHMFTLRLETVIILSIVNSASSVVGTLGNLLVVIALVNSYRLRSSTDFFIASLSIADLLVTALYQPMAVFRLNLFQMLRQNEVFRGVASFVGYLSTIASVTSMFVITIDRLVSIARPLHYINLMTKRVTYTAICVTWSFSLGVSIIYPIVKPHGSYLGIYCTSLLVGTIIMYAFILKAAKAQEDKVAANQYQGDETEGRLKHQRNERKAAKTVAIVIGVFFVCWLPLLVYSLSASQSKPWWVEGFYWAQTALLCNSFINPYIYCVRSYRYRSAIKRLLGMNCRPRPRNRIKPRSSTVSTSGATLERHRIPKEQN